MRDVPDGAAYGGHFGWMTKATNGWAAGSGGIEHGGFVGIHNTGAEEYGWQPQAGWTLRTGLTRLVGWSFSAGVAYNQNIYDEVSAPDLEAVGSHWNALARLGITIANDSRMSLALAFCTRAMAQSSAPIWASTPLRRIWSCVWWKRPDDLLRSMWRNVERGGTRWPSALVQGISFG